MTLPACCCLRCISAVDVVLHLRNTKVRVCPLVFQLFDVMIADLRLKLQCYNDVTLTQHRSREGDDMIQCGKYDLTAWHKTTLHGGLTTHKLYRGEGERVPSPGPQY